MGGFKTALKWIAIAFGGLIVVCFIALIGIGTAAKLRIIPDTAVNTGEDLSEKHYEALRDAKVLERQETVKYYYSTGFLDITDSGTIMTDRRIIGYWTEEDIVQVYAYPLETLDRLVMNVEGGEWEDAEYAVAQRGDDENSLLLYLSVEDDAHLDMITALEKQIEKNNAAYEEKAEKTEDAAKE